MQRLTHRHFHSIDLNEKRFLVIITMPHYRIEYNTQRCFIIVEI